MFSQQNSVWIQCGPSFSARRGCDFWISLLSLKKVWMTTKKHGWTIILNDHEKPKTFTVLQGKQNTGKMMTHTEQQN